MDVGEQMSFELPSFPSFLSFFPTTSISSMPTVKLTLHSGDAALHSSLLAEHLKLKTWYEQSFSSYGLPSTLDELDDVGLETLESIYPVSFVYFLPVEGL